MIRFQSEKRVDLVRTVKGVLKSTLPFAIPAYVKTKELYRAVYYRDRYMQSVFSEIYRRNLWGNEESVSGMGSTLAQTLVLRRELPELLRNINAASLLDAPCGDFNWMKEIALNVKEYIGAEIVPEIVARNQRLYSAVGRSFMVLDVASDVIPKVDVILCRDCLVHFSLRYISLTVSNFKKSGSKYLLATTDTAVRKNIDILTGRWRPLNLQLPPFNFTEPLKLIVEHPESGRSLGLWRLADL